MRLVMKTYKYKLYNNKKNKYLVQQIEIASEIWNFCIAMRRMYYLVYRKTLKANDLKKYITKICKRRKWAHWHNLGSQAIAYTVDKSFSCMGVDKLIVKVYISSASHYCFQFHFHHHHLFKEL